MVFKAIAAVSERTGSKLGKAESVSRVHLWDILSVLEGISGVGRVCVGCFCPLFDPKDTRFTGSIFLSAGLLRPELRL